jgi:hypothetical protein
VLHHITLHQIAICAGRVALQADRRHLFAGCTLCHSSAAYESKGITLDKLNQSSNSAFKLDVLSCKHFISDELDPIDTCNQDSSPSLTRYTNTAFASQPSPSKTGSHPLHSTFSSDYHAPDAQRSQCSQKALTDSHDHYNCSPPLCHSHPSRSDTHTLLPANQGCSIAASLLWQLNSINCMRADDTTAVPSTLDWHGSPAASPTPAKPLETIQAPKSSLLHSHHTEATSNVSVLANACPGSLVASLPYIEPHEAACMPHAHHESSSCSEATQKFEEGDKLAQSCLKMQQGEMHGEAEDQTLNIQRIMPSGWVAPLRLPDPPACDFALHASLPKAGSLKALILDDKCSCTLSPSKAHLQEMQPADIVAWPQGGTICKGNPMKGSQQQPELQPPQARLFFGCPGHDSPQTPVCYGHRLKPVVCAPSSSVRTSPLTCKHDTPMAQQYTSSNVTDTLTNSYGQQSTGKHLLLSILFPQRGEDSHV